MSCGVDRGGVALRKKSIGRANHVRKCKWAIEQQDTYADLSTLQLLSLLLKGRGDISIYAEHVHMYASVIIPKSSYENASSAKVAEPDRRLAPRGAPKHTFQDALVHQILLVRPERKSSFKLSLAPLGVERGFVWFRDGLRLRYVIGRGRGGGNGSRDCCDSARYCRFSYESGR